MGIECRFYGEDVNSNLAFKAVCLPLYLVYELGVVWVDV